MFLYFIDFLIYFEIEFGNQSNFDIKVQRKERLLRKGIVSYIGGASEFTGEFVNSRIDPKYQLYLRLPRARDRSCTLTYNDHASTSRTKLSFRR
jgi:hypothetical protein